MRGFKRSAFLLSALIIPIWATFCLALVLEIEQGRWPEDWPKELEPYRNQARTIEVAAGNQENIYEIRFRNRQEFENVWPTILKLKSKGAPLKLRSIEQTPADEGEGLFNSEVPVVRIYGPPCNSTTSKPGGKKLRPGPPWPESIKSPSGELPEYVTISEDGRTWAPLRTKGAGQFFWRARAEIELVADGKVIDLNRIQLPADTPIIDNRRLPFGQTQSDNHTEWIGELLMRIQSIRPGMTRGELLEVCTTEGGLSTRERRTYVYEECPYIKVDVEFKAADDDKPDEKPEDVITSISRPYLEWSIAD